MQAMRVHEYGGPEVFRADHVPDPVQAGGEVVVQLLASAVNWHDVLVRRPGRGLPLPRTLGMDGAGVRRDTGEEVVILPGLFWGSQREAPGPGFEFLGDRIDGTYAELVRVPAENVFPKPRQLSWAEAAALPTAGVTAYRALFTRCGLRAGETVLVLGAGSGVSTFAVALASAEGATVLVTSSRQDKIDRARSLGAADGVQYTEPDWVERVRELTRGAGADVVIDGVGANLQQSLQCLRPGGRLAVFGASAGAVTQIDVPGLYLSQRSVLGTSLGDATDFGGLLRNISGAAWRPVIDSVYQLGDVRHAHERIESRGQFGKIVLINQG